MWTTGITSRRGVGTFDRHKRRAATIQARESNQTPSARPVRGQQVAEAIQRVLALTDVEACGRFLHHRESGDEFERGIDIGAVVDGSSHLVEGHISEAGGIEDAPYGVRVGQGEGRDARRAVVRFGCCRRRRSDGRRTSYQTC